MIWSIVQILSFILFYEYVYIKCSPVPGLSRVHGRGVDGRGV